MKRAIIGGFLSLVGTIWCLTALLSGAAYVDQINGWYTPPGRYGTALIESGMLAPLAIGGILLACGLAAMAYEFFKKSE